MQRLFTSIQKSYYSVTVVIPIAFVLALAILTPMSGYCCDLCTVYTTDHLQNNFGPGLTLSVAEQFTSFHTLKEDGSYVENILHQSLTSSITQLAVRYNVSTGLGLQMTLPYIARHFKRPEREETVKSGWESGLGDSTMLLLTTPVKYKADGSGLRWSVRGGIKLPTGDSDRLQEESFIENGIIQHDETDERNNLTSVHQTKTPSALLHSEPARHDEDDPRNAVHGHDLALGSGSWDYLFGTNVFAERDRLFAEIDLSYTVRTEGDFDYRFQNDLLYESNVGGYLLLTNQRSVALKLIAAGEYKGMDVVRGERATDTGINSLFWGPKIIVANGESILVETSFQTPLFVKNTDLQITPDYRVRLNLSYRF